MTIRLVAYICDVSVCISIRAHVYINSYIHELLIVLMLTEKASWF